MGYNYCLVSKTRGWAQYRLPYDIVLEILRFLEWRILEITLLDIIVNKYGTGQITVVGNKTPFIQLLEKI
jgi:tRNA A37 methylthiotransferase MiaB